MDNSTETLTLTKNSHGYDICVQHDQSGSCYGSQISEQAYHQLRSHFLLEIIQEQSEQIEILKEKIQDYKFDSEQKTAFLGQIERRSYVIGILDKHINQ